MSTAVCGYQLELELHHRDAGLLAEESLLASRPLTDVDCLPLFECAKWEEALKHPRLPIVLDLADWVLAPSWDPVLGRPYIDGVTVMLGGAHATTAGTIIPLSFFNDTAKSIAAELVAAGELVAGDTCRFRVAAHARDVRVPAVHGGGAQSFSVQPVVESLEFQEADISAFLQQATAADDQHENNMPVFLPRTVLAEMHQLTREADAVETGGVLIGHLCHDRCIPEIFLQITAQIPALHAQQEMASLGLTPETWSAVEAAKDLRGLGEVHLGWWHSHPSKAWCRDCPEEKRRACRLGRDFFSCARHRSSPLLLPPRLQRGAGRDRQRVERALDGHVRLARRNGATPRISSTQRPLVGMERGHGCAMTDVFPQGAVRATAMRLPIPTGKSDNRGGEHVTS